MNNKYMSIIIIIIIIIIFRKEQLAFIVDWLIVMIDKNMIHDSDFNKLQELGFLINGELTDEYISIYKLYNNYLLHHIDSLIGLSSYI